ncbi:LAFE_0G00122g1_1 [Lachancea fermentati]|uniref:LAFE_0G00122g1_1 n=1 Tax=Lachancea fermentati TaxID=4955 RepID=A0A1G4MGT5_LACFM|nr:LAFE_0G00122g1_1 [Lachancea fermentati]
MNEYRTPKEFREICRNGLHTTHTSGVLPGYLQANLLILPSREAQDFVDLCYRNPVACPILAISKEDPTALDNEIFAKQGEVDIRTDFPKYNVYRGGHLISQKNNCNEEWNKNYIGFLIGCSYSFERALTIAGLCPKNITLGKNVAMFKTSKYLNPAGIFVNCCYVVSMRPYKPEDLQRVREITRKFKKTHGEPIDWGFDGAKRLGIHNILNPDYGDMIEILPTEIPVFWACGVTPQLAIETVGHLIEGPVVSHAPGCMLVCDAKDDFFCKNSSF